MRTRGRSAAGWGLALALALACGAAAPALRAELKNALAEKDLGRRSKLALDNAELALQAARVAYQEGNLEATRGAVNEIRESVDLAYQSLRDTGKNPRKSPHWFKSAELQTRDLLRRLDTFSLDLGYDDRPILKPVLDRVQQVHDYLLLGLMEGKLK